MFSNLKLSTKLYTGFGTLLVLLVGVGAIAYLTINTASDGFSTYRGLARDTNLSGRLQANMLMVRMNVKDFIITASDKDKEQYADYYAQVGEFLKTAQEEIHNPDRAALVDKAEEHFEGYGEAFASVVAKQDRRNELVHGVLDVEGPKVERLLTGIMQSADRDGDIDAAVGAGMCLRNLLLARLYVTKFLNSNAQDHVDRVEAEMESLNGALADLHRELQNRGRKNLLLQTIEHTDLYHENFRELVGVINERNEIITGSLDRIGPEIANDLEEVKLSVMAEQDELGPRLQAGNSRGLVLTVALAGLAVVLGLGTAFLITRIVFRQLGADPGELMRVAKDVADGDLSRFKEVDAERARGVFLSMLEMTRSLGKKVELAQAIAAKDLCQEVVLASSRDELGLALRAMSKNLQTLIGEVQEACNQVSAGAAQVSDSSQSLSSGATQTASSLEEITSSMTEISSQTTANAENAVAANRNMEQAKATVQNGREAGQEMARSMTDISTASEQVSKVIKVIDEIAFQTNLLALNAAVEAARAGQHGKGFAVVAEEVRNLAGRSAKAAKETQQLIENQLDKVERGVSLTDQLDGSFVEIVESSDQVSELISQIASASTEQAEGVGQVNEGLQQIDQVTQSNTANAEETASASEELSAQARQLAAVVGEFKINIDDDKTCGTKLRAATLRPRALGPAKADAAPKDSPAQARASGWGSAEGSAANAQQVISLDGDEFGRY